MQTFLRYIGDPGFQVGVSEDVGIHQTTVSRTVWEVSRSIVKKSSDWIKIPQTEQEMNLAKTEWQRKLKFPNAIGALDCTHVLILKPSIHGDEFINRKGLASFIVQVTCNANEKITSFDCRRAGSVHDSRIWKNSIVRELLDENPAGAILLGDEGYAITPWLMIPYRNTTSFSQMEYNKLHCKERVIIERVFGQVKRRFTILQSKIRISTNRIPTIIAACFVLHNVAKYLKEPDFDEPKETTNFETGLAFPIHDQANSTIRKRGILRRNEIARYINSISN
ncbi:PREDICTED: putative nuclease HARBI1 [Rhagoletis zephyria]|uniref:putative nuclease HARBI1 n=1 Tax=Rhagoletis zephyria TaxID=28612 RepID=UPI0008116864|nr:PREDICTED: putative nuclease HARBI1 [Rhagoletis zephyria]